ncbi:putative integral membrane protein [Theileria parva strain Muguga]|uniref:Uncharacterized protein n=1 Tax=Theileria parva TaxID=5875 RepID=Q4MYH3_THEPA|nr:putative integral membrane protein [Theileria parva strain Muguga]EAN30709.1 putative integral membrane protein [Theileria parva strain Muguga]|eukprot:XP_762992.1 hypothetical protein [Theileria parva strain Muguga]
MNKHVTYTYVLIHILIGYAICADKLNKLQPDVTNDDDDIDGENYDLVVKELETLLDDGEDYDSKKISKEVEEIFDEDDESSDDSSDEIVREIQKIIEDNIDEPSSALEQDSRNLSPSRSPFNFTSYQPTITAVTVQSSDAPVSSSEPQVVQQQSPQLFIPIIPTPTNFIHPQLYRPPYSPRLPTNFMPNISSGPYGLQILPRYPPPFTWSPRYLIPSYQKYPYQQHAGGTGVSDKPSQPSEPTESQTQPQTSDKPTEPSGTDQQLQPEHIQVEVGSDDEEPEEGAVGGAGGGDEEEKDGKRRKKRVEKLSTFLPEVRKCDKITFMKKTDTEGLIKMIWKDFYVSGCGLNITKYSFIADLEQLICDDEVIYERKPGKPYYRSVCYNNQLGSFVFESKGGLLLLRYTKGKWKPNKYKHRCPFKLFTTSDGDGNSVELTHDDYCVDVGTNGTIRYRFCNSIKCTKVMLGEELVWEKGVNEEHPLGLCTSYNGKVVLYFDGYNTIFGKRYKKYAVLSSGKEGK